MRQSAQSGCNSLAASQVEVILGLKMANSDKEVHALRLVSDITGLNRVGAYLS